MIRQSAAALAYSFEGLRPGGLSYQGISAMRGCPSVVLRLRCYRGDDHWYRAET